MSYYFFQPVLDNWFNKGCGMYRHVSTDMMVHIKDFMLLIEKSCPCSGSSGFPLMLYEWPFTSCPMLYNRKYNVLSAVFNKT